MGAVNDHVRLGTPLLERRGIRRAEMGAIYLRLGAVPQIQLNQTEVVGLVGGGALLLGSAFAKGPAATLLAVLGALGIGASAFYIFQDMLAQIPAYTPSAMPGAAGAGIPGAAGLVSSSGGAPPLIQLPPKPTRTQQALQITTAVAPAAEALVKGLVSLF